MASGTIQDSLNKDSTKAVYQKTSDILTQIQIHADQGCEHCLALLLKSGLRSPTTSEPADAGEHPKVQLRNVQREFS